MSRYFLIIWWCQYAICYYDSRLSFGSSFELLTTVKRDLVTVGQTQTSLKKHLTVPLNDINSIFRLGTPKSNVTSASASTPNPAPVSASNELAGFTKVTNTFNNNGLVNFSTSSISFVDSSIVGKRRESDNVDTSDLTNAEHNIPVQDALATFTNNVYDNCELHATEGKDQYYFATLSSKSESPHKPKLRKAHLDALKK
ncbi:hypothetical protein INT48_008568 [Thamnidium elegans]|uniref:Uncharacterized protein n=1 Tax=Thamnidium elegans TaxID=101142 RepID=A0A8H7SWQ8_9FUNG|nr:hypothetical protein INT48_008568 [Thamnidium elegans]